jgi:sodium-coupled neutral amino acid transporter 2
MLLLCRATEVAGQLDLKAVVGAVLGTRWVLATQIAIILNNIGLCIVYLIIVGDVTVGTAGEPGLLAPLGPPFADNKYVCVGAVTVLLVAPLCMLRRVDSLKYSSGASMVLSGVFIVVTFAVLFSRVSSSTPIGALNWFSERGASVVSQLKALAVFITAYVSHYNIHPIFSEMAAPTQRRMGLVIRGALWSTTLVYWLVALSCYLLFTSRTAPDVLLNYGDTGIGGRIGRAVEVIVKVAYMLSLIGTFPLIQLALRQSLFDLRGWGPAAEVDGRRFVGVTAALLALEFMLALAVPDISTAFGVLGSTVSVYIGFILPAMLSYRARLSVRDVRLGGALLAIGVVLGMVSFGATVVGLFV